MSRKKLHTSRSRSIHRSKASRVFRASENMTENPVTKEVKKEWDEQLMPRPIFIRDLELKLLSLQNKRQRQRRHLVSAVTITSASFLVIVILISSFSQNTLARSFAFVRTKTEKITSPYKEAVASAPQNATTLTPDLKNQEATASARTQTAPRSNATKKLNTATPPSDVSTLLQQVETQLSHTDAELSSLNTVADDKSLEQALQSVQGEVMP